VFNKKIQAISFPVCPIAISHFIYGKKKKIPNVKGTIYKRAGCPWPSIRFKATYVTSRPERK
jgi:hypothetical protein